MHDAYTQPSIGKPQHSPSHRPISHAAIAAKHHAQSSRQLSYEPESPIVKGMGPAAAPKLSPPQPTVLSPPRKHNPNEHDGPFPRLYEGVNHGKYRGETSFEQYDYGTRDRASSNGSGSGGYTGGSGNIPPSAGWSGQSRAAPAPTPPIPPMIGASASQQTFGLRRPSQEALHNNGAGSNGTPASAANGAARRPSHDESGGGTPRTLTERLDAQQALLEQAQQMAMAAEARAEAAMRLNRYILAGVLAAVVVVAVRAR